MTDVLIVGAGSAGSVLAERLSADPGRRVTVLDSGPSRSTPAIRALTDDATVLPIGPGSPVVRHYRTALTAAHDSQIVRGSVVGGSGAVNGGYFCRALPTDFGTDVPGWSWADVEPHYRAVEERISAQPHRDIAASTAAFVVAAQAARLTVTRVPLNIVDGIRRGPGAVFLEPVLQRPNLTVLPETRATRLSIAGGRATGVHARGPDGEVRIDADRVVLAAGAVESAHLLMLSGIGPGELLSALRIPTVADLPVGQAFQDHPEWLMATDFPSTPGHPALEAVLIIGNLEIRPYTTGFDAPTTGIGVALMRPRSRGRITLISADPSVAPRIEHRYDSEPADVADLQRGCDLIAEILRGSTRLSPPVWSTSQHLCATAPMGAVVDPQCRVIGLVGLQVIDGSVLPRIPSRGPHATITMLAHRAAEFFT